MNSWHQARKEKMDLTRAGNPYLNIPVFFTDRWIRLMSAATSSSLQSYVSISVWPVVFELMAFYSGCPHPYRWVQWNSVDNHDLVGYDIFFLTHINPKNFRPSLILHDWAKGRSLILPLLGIHSFTTLHLTGSGQGYLETRLGLSPFPFCWAVSRAWVEGKKLVPTAEKHKHT